MYLSEPQHSCHYYIRSSLCIDRAPVDTIGHHWTHKTMRMTDVTEMTTEDISVYFGYSQSPVTFMDQLLISAL